MLLNRWTWAFLSVSPQLWPLIILTLAPTAESFQKVSQADLSTQSSSERKSAETDPTITTAPASSLGKRKGAHIILIPFNFLRI